MWTPVCRSVGLLLLVLAFAGAPALAGQDEVATLADVKTLLEARQSEDKIIEFLKSCGEIRITAEDYPKLKEWGAGEKLLSFLKERSGGGGVLDQVQMLLTQGKDEDAVVEWILTNTDRMSVEPKDILRLKKWNAGPKIVQALERTYVFPTLPQEYRDPLGFMSAQYPAGWRSYIWYTGEGVKILLSPETDVKAANLFKTGFQIQMDFLEKLSPHRQKNFDILEWHKKGLQGLIEANRKYELKPVEGGPGVPKSGKIAGHPTVEQEFTVTMEETACRETLVRIFPDDVSFFIEFVAPKADYEKLKPVFRKMLLSLRPYPDRVRLSRRNTPMRATDSLDYYREATVRIVNEGGSGSGFFVREDGYILTNHHVICLAQNHLACTTANRAKQISIEWDEKVEGEGGEPRKPIRVDLVDTLYILSPFVDMALLKAPPGRKPFKTIPISTLSSGLTMQGDPVAALGFPLQGGADSPFRKDTLVLTEGRIATITEVERKFRKKDSAKDYDHLILDININPGNSGGPCVNLATGAVIGLNSAVPHARLWGSKEAQRLDYATVSLVDHALYYFPQISWYPKRRKLGCTEHLELGAMLLAKGNDRSAEVEFLQALPEANDLSPEQRARLYPPIYLCLPATGQYDESQKSLARSLEEDPAHLPALRDLAYTHANRRELDKAIPLVDKAIKANPNDWSPRWWKADMYRRAEQYEEALKALKEATDRGGEGQGVLIRLQAEILLDMGEHDKGLEAYKKAVELDRYDYQARLGIANYYVRKNNAQRALIEYTNVSNEFPNEATVRETFGRYLLTTADRKEQGLDEMIWAIKITLDGGKSPPALLRDTAREAMAQPKYVEDGRICAQLLHRDWPAWGYSAHTLLQTYWKNRGMTAIAVAHQNAASTPRDANGRKLPRKQMPPAIAQAFQFKDLQTLAPVGYSGALLEEILGEACIGALFTDERMEVFKRWPQPMTMAVSRCYLADQLYGGEGLGMLMSTKIVSKQVTTGDREGYCDLELKNNSELYLTNIRLRNTYSDKNDKVLWNREAELDLGNPIFAPGETRVIRYYFDSWEAMGKAGLAKENVFYYRVNPASARNADYVLGISVEGKVTPDGYQLAIINQSSFTVKSLTVKCAYVNEKKVPYLDANGRPIAIRKVYTTTLGPQKKTPPTIEKDWSDPAAMARRGAPAGSYLLVSVIEAKIE